MSKSSDDPDKGKTDWQYILEAKAAEIKISYERTSNIWNYGIVHRRIHAYIESQDLDGKPAIFDEIDDRVLIDVINGEDIIICGGGMVDIDSPSEGNGGIALPPTRAEKLLYLIVSKDSRDQIAGDLEEEYRSVILPKFGLDYAKRWYWMQVARSIGPILWGQLTKLVKLGVFAKVTEWLSEKISG